LQAHQQEQLKKCFTERLWVKLAQTGICEINIQGQTRSSPPCQISPSSVQRVASAWRKTSKPASE